MAAEAVAVAAAWAVAVVKVWVAAMPWAVAAVVKVWVAAMPWEVVAAAKALAAAVVWEEEPGVIVAVDTAQVQETALGPGPTTALVTVRDPEAEPMFREPVWITNGLA